MPSPFPGMDPYLEKHWRDVHAALIIYIRDALRPVLPRDLRPRVEERLVIDAPQAKRSAVNPDIRIVETSCAPAVPQTTRSGGATAVVATDEPLLVPLDVEEVTETYVDIVEAGAAHRIVTTIEVLSPTNKRPGEDRRNYIRKQRKMLDGLVNIVEIDLLRTGLPVTAVPQVSIPEDRRTPLHVCVRRTTTPLVAEVYPIPLRERLPIIRVPLRETDADVALDLQTLIGQCWENGGYDDIDYSAPAEPPLEGPDAAWADALLRERKLRADPPAA